MKQSSSRFMFVNQALTPDIANILIIIVIWIMMEVIIGPYGDFPLNDDWVYGLSVSSILSKGDFQLFDSTTNLVSQVFWGALFCLPFGFSFNVLRISCLVLGIIGIITTYIIFREIKVPPRISLIGALVIAVNPIYVNLSNTFMTDIPFFTLTAISIYLLIRGLEHDSKIEVTIGHVIAYVALLIRQLGLAISIAFGVGFLIKKGLSVQNFIKAFIPTLIGIAIQLFYQGWLKATMRLIPHHDLMLREAMGFIHSGKSHIAFKFIEVSFVAIIYLGLFIFPLLIVLFFIKYKELSSVQKIYSLLFSSFISVVIVSIMVSKNVLMPLGENIIYNCGLGPVTLRDTYLLRLPHLPVAPKIFWLIPTTIGVIGATLLLQYFFFALQVFWQNRKFELDRKWIIVFVTSAILIYFIPLVTVNHIFDRYYLPLLLLLMLLVSVTNTNINKWNISNSSVSIALVTILLYGIFSTGATHDYFSWNRARWQALNDLTKELKISPRDIDGGYEFNGFYLYDSNYKPSSGKDWWVIGNDYIISFGPMNGYKEVGQYKFQRWIPFGQGDVFVLRKIG